MKAILQFHFRGNDDGTEILSWVDQVSTQKTWRFDQDMPCIVSQQIVLVARFLYNDRWV